MRDIGGQTYVYLSFYDRRTESTKNVYCGKDGRPATIVKACDLELELIRKQQEHLGRRADILRRERRQAAGALRAPG